MRCAIKVLRFQKTHTIPSVSLLLLSSQIKLFLLQIALVLVFCHSNGKGTSTKDVLVTTSALLLGAQARSSLLLPCSAHRHQQPPCFYDLMVMFTAPQSMTAFVPFRKSSNSRKHLSYVHTTIDSECYVNACIYGAYMHMCTCTIHMGTDIYICIHSHNMHMCTHCVHTCMSARYILCKHIHIPVMYVWTHLCAQGPTESSLLGSMQFLGPWCTLQQESHCSRKRQLGCICHPYRMHLETDEGHSGSVGDPELRDTGMIVSLLYNGAEKGVWTSVYCCEDCDHIPFTHD